MGKGDKKTRRGKINIGTFGVRRPRKTKKSPTSKKKPTEKKTVKKKTTKKKTKASTKK